MKRNALGAALMAVLLPCAGAFACEDFGLSKVSVFDNPDPLVTTQAGREPGENEALGAYFDESPPLIPHLVADYLPITIKDNQCLDCHDAPDRIGKKLGRDEEPPMPASHYTDLRNAPHKVTGKPIGARFVCTQCHAGQQETEVLVESTYRQ